MGRPSKLTPHQLREAIARRDAGEALTDIRGREPNEDRKSSKKLRDRSRSL
jgi:hypothetical protein